MGSAALMAGDVLLTRGRETSCRWRLRLAIYPILMDALFPHMRWVSPFINEGRKDALLWELDRRLFGGSLSVWLEPMIQPVKAGWIMVPGMTPRTPAPAGVAPLRCTMTRCPP